VHSREGWQEWLPVPIFCRMGPDLQALTEKSVADKIPLVTSAYGRTEAIDGRVFPYASRTVSASGAGIVGDNFIAGKAGGKDKLKGSDRDRLSRLAPTARRRRSPRFLARPKASENPIPVRIRAIPVGAVGGRFRSSSRTGCSCGWG